MNERKGLAATLNPRRPGQASPELRDASIAALRRLREKTPEFKSAGLVGPDGFEIAAISSGGVEVTKLAALTSTLVAVAEAFMLEAGLEKCRNVILESAHGPALLVSIPAGPATYGLFLITGSDATLGRVLLNARGCAAEMQVILGTCGEE
ncbi:MAG: roadblock/LC7 domain-containing protein [Bryobacteraceae bacterium]